MNDLVCTSILLILISCNGPNKPTNNSANDSLITHSKTVVVDSVKIITHVPPLNISDWGAFWKVFKGAVHKMDTSRIIGLTHFPYVQNGTEINEIEFKEYIIEHLAGLEKATEPVGDEGIPGYSSDDVSPTDSAYFVSFNHMDITFSKVKGYYKLVRIITPG